MQQRNNKLACCGSVAMKCECGFRSATLITVYMRASAARGTGCKRDNRHFGETDLIDKDNRKIMQHN